MKRLLKFALGIILGLLSSYFITQLIIYISEYKFDAHTSVNEWIYAMKNGEYFAWMVFIASCGIPMLFGIITGFRSDFNIMEMIAFTFGLGLIATMAVFIAGFVIAIVSAIAIFLGLVKDSLESANTIEVVTLIAAFFAMAAPTTYIAVIVFKKR